MPKVSLSFEKVLILIRHAITTGCPKSAIGLIDDVLENLAKGKEESQPEKRKDDYDG